MKLIYPIVAMLCITAVLLYAMHLGRDGILMAGGVAVLAALGGYIAPHKKKNGEK